MARMKSGVLACSLVVLLSATAGATAARAEDGQVDAPVRLGISLTTKFPVSSGLEAQLELPARFYVSGGVGVIPVGFLHLVNETAVELEAWPEDLGGFAANHVDRTSVLSGALGWRPTLGGGGLFVELSAARVQVSVSAYSSEVFATFAPGASLELTDGDRRAERLNVDLTVDLVGGQVGWMWELDPVYVRAGIGGLAAVRASVQANVDWSDGSNSGHVLLGEVANDWSGEFLRNVRIPMGTLTLGVRLF